MLRPDGTIDRQRTAELVELARPLSVTFHKAFDQTRDHEQALDALIALGIDRVLTSGCRPTAREGIEILRRLVDHSQGRIAILAGGRLSAGNLASIITTIGVREVHLGSAVTRPVAGVMESLPSDGSSNEWNRVDAVKVREIVDLVARIDAEMSGTP